MAKARAEIAPQDQWNVEALYTSLEAWEADLADIQKEGSDAVRWPQPAKFKGKLGEGAQVLADLFACTFELERRLVKLYTYAHLRSDEDLTNDTYKAAQDKIMSLFHSFSQECSWIQPEILALPDDTIKSYLKAAELADYQFHLEKALVMREHTLDDQQERLLALAGKSLATPSKAFSALSDADFTFGSVEDGKGEMREITHGSYGLFLRDQDRILRERAFIQYHEKYAEHSNTMGELLGGQVQKHVFNYRSRNFDSCLQAALKPKNIDEAVYTNLVTTIRNNVDALHKYISLRKRLLGVDELHLWDMYVPLSDDVEITMPYEEAESVVIESVAPLGQEYQEKLRRGLSTDCWVDRYENIGKRSGAYSSGCYDSMPYILMNYKNVLRDVFTLAHEAGHSMHSLYSRDSQPYHYADYPIFVAEVASTFNEALLIKTLRERFTAPEEQFFLVTQQIEDLRATLFRQTMFAEFELAIHEMAEREEPLTPTALKEAYLNLNRDYFGDGVTIDPQIGSEWSRIPHFYYNFYVYQYATGISAAHALVEGVLNGGDAEREAYLGFLKGGCSKYPLDLLKDAGVDMLSPEPVEKTVKLFDGLVDELDQLSQQAAMV